MEACFVDIASVELDATGNLRAFYGVVHSVQSAQQRAFSAAAGANEGQDLIWSHVERDVAQRENVVVPHGEVFDVKLGARGISRTNQFPP
jgi:hypothetical protein